MKEVHQSGKPQKALAWAGKVEANPDIKRLMPDFASGGTVHVHARNTRMDVRKKRRFRLRHQ